MNPLEQRIGYKFRNSLLLAEALTHPSLGHETQRHHFDNQRLEFLGDAVLQLIFTEHLYRLFPHFSEGQLTKLRSRLVSREGLKVHAINIGLGTYLMMGRGEEASGGRKRASILADAFEALVGAMYLDSNLETVRRFVLDEAQDDIHLLSLQPLEVNPKGQLQEILQAISARSPIYEIVSQAGPEHQKLFIAKVLWEGLELGVGDGSSKKQAETAAALAALHARRWEEQAALEPPNTAGVDSETR
jgi:ribonuclease III